MPILLLPACFAFVLGAVMGSFGNVVVLRGEKRESLGGRSHCPHCKTTLRWTDLVPVLSFLMLRGRCRACKAPISWQYPLVEGASGVLFLLAFLHHDFTPLPSILLALACLVSYFTQCAHHWSIRRWSDSDMPELSPFTT